MNKLLHERFREIEKSGSILSCLKDLIGEKHCPDVTCQDCVRNTAKMLADEIEKHYDPKLHFEDGELVSEGDKYVDKLGNECTISSIKIHARIWDENGKHEAVDVRKPLKRPESKALDADGVEIKDGYTVYTKSGIKCTVEKIGTQQCEGMEDWDGTPWIMFDNGSWMHAHDVTHREPDSLEKLRNDMREFVDTEYKIPGGTKTNEWLDRLTAIMERDA